MATFAEEIAKSVNNFRVVISMTSVDGTWTRNFSFNEEVANASEGRLLSAPKISIARDSSYFGILTYSSSGFTVANHDGEYDTLFEDYNVIGASIQVKIGFSELTLAQYQTIYTGYLESATVSEDMVSFSVADLKKRLSTYNTSDYKFVNAIQAIETCLTNEYGATAGSFTTAFTAAKTLSANTSTIFRVHPAVDTVAALIGDCVKSTFGFFYIAGDGRYSYKLIDNTATSVTTISRYDIFDPVSVKYDGNKVLASVSVGCPIIDDNMSVAYVSTYSFINTIQPGAIESDAGYVFIPQDAGPGNPINIYRSIDKGSSFSNVLSVSKTTALAIFGNMIDFGSGRMCAFIAGTNTASTSQTVVYRSSDYGSSWSAVATPLYDSVFCSVLMSSTGSALAGGKRGAYNNWSASNISRTLDYGSTWTVIGTAASMVIQYIATPPSRGIVYGAFSTNVGYPAYIESSPTGSTWTLIRTIDPYATALSISFNGLVCEDDKTVVAYQKNINSSGIIHGYMDVSVSSSGTYYWNQIRSMQANESYYFKYLQKDANGDLYYSDDAGAIWKSNEYGPDNSAIWYRVIPSQAYPLSYMLLCGKASGKLYYINYPDISLIGRKVDKSFEIETTTSHLASTYSALGINTTKYFSTILAYNAQASALGTKLSDYYANPKGSFTITVPMSYYALEVGDNVDVEVWRETTTMLGTKKCEIMGKAYDLSKPAITFDLRIIS